MSETVKTYLNVAIMLVAAIIVGRLLGGSVQYFLGNDQDSVATTAFNDRMSVIKQEFAETNQAYQDIAQELDTGDYGELRVIRNKKGEIKVVEDGNITDLAAFPETIQEEINQQFTGVSQAVSEATDFAGDPITDIQLIVIYHKGNETDWYCYFSDHGYIAIIHTDRETITENMNIVTLSTDEDFDDGWGIKYSFD